ncbi:MAG: HAD family hydrolase [Erysipelotrichaceae bacterium]|nr:HAD family hydrolase [Erysipelotrichaceae bacterium]
MIYWVIKMIKTDGIILDVDGTIWDSTGAVADLWNEAIAEFGLDIRVSAPILQSVFGKTMDEIGDILFPMLSEEDRRRLSNNCHDKENKGLRNHPGSVYEGMEEMLSALSKTHDVYILSNCQSGYIETLLEVTGFGKYIKDFTCFGDTGKGKAENIKDLVKKYEMKCPVYVGDTMFDYHACTEAGVPFIFASYGFGKVEDYIGKIDKPMDLVALLGE